MGVGLTVPLGKRGGESQDLSVPLQPPLPLPNYSMLEYRRRNILTVRSWELFGLALPVTHVPVRSPTMLIYLPG